jgi:uncharacterized protein (DUF736 family)
MNSVQVKVAEKIADISPRVEDQVVEVLVGRELEKRSEALVKILDILDQLEKDMKKVKPDQRTYSETGEELTATWSKSKLDERNKLNVKLDKIGKAIDKALDTGDYDDVNKLIKGGGDQKQGSGTDQDQTT